MDKNIDDPKFLDETQLNPDLEIIVIKSKLPETLACFKSVLISVPSPRDEKNNCGDKHMKRSEEHYLQVNYSEKEGLLFHVPEHYFRCDFTVPVVGDENRKRCAVTRHFFVRPESLGQKIIASVSILRNDNGSISINICELVDQNAKPEYQLKMRPVKPEEKETDDLFLISGTDKCVNFERIERRILSL